VLDRGLGPALAILAGTSGIPARLADSVSERPSPAIEAMAYFCAAELLANVAKHSGASRVTIGVRDQGAGLVMSVTDDGDGGARLVPGGGQAGLLERVQTVDGRLGLDSPPGGPTVVTVEGYLLKDRVADVSEFIDAITRVAQGGTVLDPEVVRQLLSAGRRGTPWPR
jgi:signal transduction histidine kinase